MVLSIITDNIPVRVMKNLISGSKCVTAESGLSDFEAIETLAKTAKLILENDHAMPAKNRLLVFKKIASS